MYVCVCRSRVVVVVIVVVVVVVVVCMYVCMYSSIPSSVVRSGTPILAACGILKPYTTVHRMAFAKAPVAILKYDTQQVLYYIQT